MWTAEFYFLIELIFTYSSQHNNEHVEVEAGVFLDPQPLLSVTLIICLTGTLSFSHTCIVFNYIGIKIYFLVRQKTKEAYLLICYATVTQCVHHVSRMPQFPTRSMM